LPRLRGSNKELQNCPPLASLCPSVNPYFEAQHLLKFFHWTWKQSLLLNFVKIFIIVSNRATIPDPLLEDTLRFCVQLIVIFCRKKYCKQNLSKEIKEISREIKRDSNHAVGTKVTSMHFS
jgi:hypothetical protein